MKNFNNKTDLNNQTPKDQILSKIGAPVVFKYPNNEGTRTGRLVDRVVFESDSTEGEIPYYEMMDLISFEGESEPCIRHAYYRKPKNKLIFGSQTTSTIPISRLKKYYLQAAKESPWFREILDEVIEELRAIEEDKT
jgi:hypothetical protein